MKLKTFILRTNLLSKLLLSLALLIGSVDVWADELTINGSSSNSNRGVPFNAGMLTTSGTYGEFLVLSSQISSIASKNITGLTFYTNKAANWGTASFTVCLKEVDNSYYTTSPLGDSGTTTVFTGSLSASADKEVSIVFDTPFSYTGTKNLLVRINCTNTTGTNIEVNFTGLTGDYSTSSYKSYGCTTSYTKQSFQPKVQFSYEAPLLPTLSISPDGDADFGTVWTNATKTDYYTITNNSASTVNVTAVIDGTDASSFSVSPSAAQDIASGATQTYSITYTYDSSSLGEKTATITFTPDGDDTNAITKNITATAVPDLQISSLDGSFGEVTADANKVYTITNQTGATVSITPSITGTNADMFSVSPDEETAIADGESQNFTVTFDWQADLEKFGDKTATITLTPNNGYDPFVISASATATADVVLDESKATTWTSGSGKSVLVKYQPVVGWNTLCLPITTSGNIPKIFGSSKDYGTKYYTFTSYEDGVLSFTKTSGYVGANKPCLVYVTTAKDNSAGVLLTGEYVYQASSATPGSDGEGKFQGTYVRKDYDGDNWYGVTPAGRIMKAGTGAYVKGYRAYFTGVSAPASGGDVKMFIIGGDDIPTDVGFVKMVDADAKEVYNLAGQRVQKARKGIYIVNGKKVVIK